MPNSNYLNSHRFKATSLAFVILLGAWFSSTASSANYEITICDNCSGSQYSQAAVAAGCPWEYDVYAVNRPDSIVKAFDTICSYDPGYTIEKAVQISGDPVVLANINDTLDFYHALRGPHQISAASLAGLPNDVDSAIDLVDASYNQVLVGDALEQHLIQTYLPNPIPQSMQEIMNNLPSKFTIEFADGSTYDYEFEDADFNQNGDLILEYKRVPNSGIDPNGQSNSGNRSGSGKQIACLGAWGHQLY